MSGALKNAGVEFRAAKRGSTRGARGPAPPVSTKLARRAEGRYDGSKAADDWRRWGGPNTCPEVMASRFSGWYICGAIQERQELHAFGNAKFLMPTRNMATATQSYRKKLEKTHQRQTNDKDKQKSDAKKRKKYR